MSEDSGGVFGSYSGLLEGSKVWTKSKSCQVKREVDVGSSAR
jgi:hypothetical protein